MLEKLKIQEDRFKELERLLSDLRIIEQRELWQNYSRELASLMEPVELYRKYKRICGEIHDCRQMLVETDDQEMAMFLEQELSALISRQERLTEMLTETLIPENPSDRKSVFMEIRAGTGGEEAALFAADLLRMYTRFAEQKGWKIELVEAHPTDIGGFKEVVVGVEGRGVYGLLKYESGVHRVQRVPTTESSGRIHTSAATVAVLPEAEEVELEINPQDLRIDVFCSTGPGGQSVNTTQSAVRVTHIPTGIVVSCQDEKSQHKNKDKALRVLRSRLLDKFVSDQEAEVAQTRRQMIGSGDRSERIRTYNFPQNRVTDHRIGLTLHKLDLVLAGELDEIIRQLAVAEKDRQLQVAKG